MSELSHHHRATVEKILAHPASGNVEWLCSPRPDGRSVFASMLDRAAGSFRLGPTGVLVP